VQKLVEVVVDMDTSQLTGVRPHAQLLGGDKGEGAGRRREVEDEEGEEEEGGDRQRGQSEGTETDEERTRELHVRRLIFVVSIWGMGGGY